MEKNKIIITIISIIFMLIIISISILYIINPNFDFMGFMGKQSGNIDSGDSVKIKPLTPEEIRVQNKINYPNTIIGTIRFLDSKEKIRSIVKTVEGKEYILSPDQSKIIYESFGLKNGDKVQVDGKIVDDKIIWLNIKAI